MIRFGLCCQFFQEKIDFKTIQYRHFSNLNADEKKKKLAEVILNNLSSLLNSIEYCSKNEIGSFRVISTLLPLFTHTECKYRIEDLPGSSEMLSYFDKCKKTAFKNDIRIVFHPDQFVVLNSPRSSVIEAAIQDLVYHAYLADLLGADVINIHAGGVYNDKESALRKLKEVISTLPKSVTSLLTLENDDKSYTPKDLLPLCEEMKIPLVYDVHHHRCLPDGLSEEEASKRAYDIWNREPLFHISSPKEGWDGPKPSRHHDYIDPKDFPLVWNKMQPLTVEVEAKAKELAVLRLQKEILDSMDAS